MNRRQRERRQNSYNAARSADFSRSRTRDFSSSRTEDFSSSQTKGRLCSHFDSLFAEAEETMRDIVSLEFGLSTRPQLEFELKPIRRGPGASIRLSLSPTITVFVPELTRKPDGRTPEDPDALELAAGRAVRAIRLGVGLQRYGIDERTTCVPFRDRSDLFHCNFVFYFDKLRHKVTWAPPYVYRPERSARGDTVYELVSTDPGRSVGDSLEEKRMEDIQA